MKLAFFTFATLGLAAEPVCPPTPVWSVCEIRLPAETGQVAEFRSPSHRTFSIHSFPAGGREVLRIVPTEAGEWDYRFGGQEGKFTAVASQAPGYVEAANVHHFRYTGSKEPHLWMGSKRGAPFTHVRVVADPAHDAEILAIHKAGQTADLVVPPGADMADLIARYGALNITWQLPNGAPKVEDQYRHLSQYRTYRSADGDAPAIEHQTFAVPFLNDFGAGITAAAEFRRALWRTTLDGAYPESEPPDETAAAQMKLWYDFFSATRFWELEPYFDAGGRRALALDGVEYVVYAETPGPVEVTVQKHNYEVVWFNPVTGERVEEKNLKAEVYSGSPPDTKQDWVLHLSREGHKAAMRKTYKFESREILQQEVEAVKVPYEIVEPAGETISLAHPGAFAVKLTKDTKAARAMRYLWTGEVSADGRGERILGTGASGQLKIPADLALRLPALLHLRVEGLNGVGKLYTIDRNYQLVP